MTSPLEVTYARLQNFVSNDPACRTEAQQWFSNTELDVVFNSLLDIAKPSVCNSSELRGLAWVLIRSRLGQVNAKDYESIADFLKTTVATKCIEILNEETDKTVHNRMAAAVSLIAETLTLTNYIWTNLWDLIRDWLSQTDQVEKLQKAFQLINHSSENLILIDSFESKACEFVNMIENILMKNASNYEITSDAFKTVASLSEGLYYSTAKMTNLSKLLQNSKDVRNPKLKKFRITVRQLGKPMISILNEYIQACPQVVSTQQLQELLTHCLTIAKSDSSFWTPHSIYLIDISHKIAVNRSLDKGLRNCALQLSFQLYKKSLIKVKDKTLDEQLQDQLCTLISQCIQESKTTFKEPSENVEDEFEELIEPDIDSDDPFKQLLNQSYGFIDLIFANDNFSQKLLKLIDTLISSNDPAMCICASQLLQLYISDKTNPMFIEEVLNLNLLLLKQSSANSVRYCGLTVLKVFLENNWPILQTNYTQDILKTLFDIAVQNQSKPIKKLVIITFTAFLTPLDDDADSELINMNVIETILSSIVSPEFTNETNDISMQRECFTLTSSIALLAKQRYLPFFETTMNLIYDKLPNRIFPCDQTVFDPDKHEKQLELCEAAIICAASICETVDASIAQKHVKFLIDQTLVFLKIILSEKIENLTSVSVSLVIDSLSSFIELVKDNFDEYNSLLQVVFQILEKPEKAACSTQNISMNAISKLLAGNADCEEDEEGNLKFSVKNLDGENETFEFRTRIIEERVSALQVLTTLLTVAPEKAIPHYNMIEAKLLEDLRSSFSIIRAPAAEASVALLKIFILADLEKNVPAAQSRCALATNQITPLELITLIQKFCMPLLNEAVNSQLPSRVAEALNPVEELFEIFYESSKIKFLNLTPEIHNFCREVFRCLGDILVKTVKNELSRYSEDKKEDDFDQECDDISEVLSDESIDSLSNEDYEGSIYSSVMRSVAYLFQVYGSNLTDLFKEFLQSPMSALMTASQINMAGRATSLFAFANLMKYGKDSEIASTVLPVALLYARCNEVIPGLENDEDDVERVQAAAYCIGIISEVNPDVLIKRFDITIKTLHSTLEHPNAKSNGRLLASECAFSALIKIFINPMYNEKATQLNLQVKHIVQLLDSWFPLTEDEDESCELVDFILDYINGQKVAPWLYNEPLFRQQMLQCLIKLKELIVLKPEFVFKETRLSEIIPRAIATLQNTTNNI